MKKIRLYLAYPIGRGIWKQWFTFIELMIVISILAILSVAWIMSFGDKIDNLKANSILEEFSWDIWDLDNKVANKQIFDYEIILEKWKKYYLVNENIFDTDYQIELSSINNNILNLKINNWLNSWTGSIKIYEWYKFQKQDTKNWDETFTGSFLENKNYKIVWTYSGSVLNNLEIKNFWKNFKLIKIDPNIWPDLGSISIKNILWKKQFWNDENINKIVLTFEDELWKDYNLEIKK